MENKSDYGNTKIEFPKCPPTISSYYNEIIKGFEKYISMIRPNYKGTVNNQAITPKAIPATIPANAYDICNYITKYDIANFQIQAIMKLDGRLDFDKLVRAVRLSFDTEPVLGCQFIKSDPPYWKRFDDMDNIKFCTIEETDNSDEAVQRFLESPMDMDTDPMVIVKLIRSCDTIGLKINHVCSDGAGAKEYIQLLSDIYSHIDQEESVFTPNPSIRSWKDHEKLLSKLSQYNSNTEWSPLSQMLLTTWKFPWKNIRTGKIGFAVCRLPYGHLDILSKYAKSRGASINDLILTAVFRAMFEIAKPPYCVPMDIPITIDLRKYLPNHKAEAIRNFSGGVILRINRKANELFEETLSRVMALTKDMKSRHPSFENIKGLEVIEKISFHQICAYFKTLTQIIEFASQSPFTIIDRCSPILSNVGFISKSLLKFGENTVTDAYIIPPVIRAPGILIVASTYNGIISLAVGYYEPSV
ncbi:MAG: condensation domain-containing protein, partial [Ruminiclostridium sp.]